MCSLCYPRLRSRSNCRNDLLGKNHAVLKTKAWCLGELVGCVWSVPSCFQLNASQTLSLPSHVWPCNQRLNSGISSKIPCPAPSLASPCPQDHSLPDGLSADSQDLHVVWLSFPHHFLTRTGNFYYLFVPLITFLPKWFLSVWSSQPLGNSTKLSIFSIFDS